MLGGPAQRTSFLKIYLQKNFRGIDKIQFAFLSSPSSAIRKSDTAGVLLLAWKEHLERAHIGHLFWSQIHQPPQPNPQRPLIWPVNLFKNIFFIIENYENENFEFLNHEIHLLRCSKMYRLLKLLDGADRWPNSCFLAVIWNFLARGQFLVRTKSKTIDRSFNHSWWSYCLDFDKMK